MEVTRNGPAPGPPSTRLRLIVWRQAQHMSAPYLLHDADPLAWVADAWAARFEGRGVAGDLEVAIMETVARWRARSVDLPDYYLVVDPEELSPVRRHWFLGVLASAAPARVRAVPASEPVIDQLAELPTGPWWPRLDHLVADLDRVLPEQAGLLAAQEPEDDMAKGLGSPLLSVSGFQHRVEK